MQAQPPLPQYGSTAKEPAAQISHDEHEHPDGDGSGGPLPSQQWSHLQTPKGVFVTGKRLRMNIIPCFLNIFMPWGIFIFISTLLKSTVHYHSPTKAYALWSVFFVFACFVTGMAMWARGREPDPTWFTFSSLQVWFAVILGTYVGLWNYDNFMHSVYEMEDLKVVAQIDALAERGQNHIDGGIFYFAHGNHLDHVHSWHFTHGTTYCVTPIVGKAGEAPTSGFYDFWAVGKDCCSTQAADFRCGDYANPNARSGLRVLDSKDQAFYRLAVEQTETNYNIKSAFPVFVTWDVDPLDTVASWQVKSYNYHEAAIFSYLTWCVVTTAFATFRFAWIGRPGGLDEMKEGWKSMLT